VIEKSVIKLAKVKEIPARLWTLNILLVCFSSFSVYIAFYGLLATLPVYIYDFGGLASTIGLALGLISVAAVIIRPLAGIVLDRYGRKKILITGLFLFLLPTLAYVWLIPVAALLVFCFVQGFGWGICTTSLGTVATDVIPKDRLGEGLGSFGAASSISMASAPALSLWLIETFSFRIWFVVAALLCIISIVLALNIKFSKLEGRQKEDKLVFLEKATLRPAIVVLLIAVAYSSLFSFLALFMRHQGRNDVGVFFAVLAATTLVSRFYYGRIVDVMGKCGCDLGIMCGAPAIIIGLLGIVFRKFQR